MTYPTDPANYPDAAAEHARRVQDTATPYRAETADEIVDDVPALTTSGDEFDNSTDPTSEANSVDLSDMPALRDFSRDLPSVRQRVLAAALEVIILIPEDLLKQGADKPSGEDDLAEKTIDLDQLRNVVGMSEAFEAAEKFVMDVAYDPDAMREWLIEKGTIRHVMGAFNLAQAHVKN